MNAKRKFDTRTIFIGLTIALIIVAVVFVLFAPSDQDDDIPQALTVREVWQNRNKYIGERITVEGFYYLSLDGPSLVPAVTATEPDPTMKINLDNTSFDLAKQEANITVSNNLKYQVVGVLEEIESPNPIFFDVELKVETIRKI